MPSLPRSPFGRRSRTAADVKPERTEPRVEIVESPGLRWINVERPRSLEQKWLEERFDFHPLDYEDVRSRNQRPKVDEYDDYLFIVLHFPRYDKAVGRLNAAEALGGLPGLQRASPSTPLDVAVFYVGANITVGQARCPCPTCPHAAYGAGTCRHA